jgi:hypothetical protein
MYSNIGVNSREPVPLNTYHRSEVHTIHYHLFSLQIFILERADCTYNFKNKELEEITYSLKNKFWKEEAIISDPENLP